MNDLNARIVRGPMTRAEDLDQVPAGKSSDTAGLPDIARAVRSQTKGLWAFSSATVVRGPWPGQSRVSGGKVRICSRTF